MGRHTAVIDTDREEQRREVPHTPGERRAALAQSGSAHTGDAFVKPSIASDTAQRGMEPPAPIAAAPDHVVVDAIPESSPAQPAAKQSAAQQRVRRVQRVVKAPSDSRPHTPASTIRRKAAIPALSFFAVFGFVGGSLVNPFGGAAVASTAVIAAPAPTGSVQYYTAHGTYADSDVSRDDYGVTKPAPVVVAPAATTTKSTSTTSSKSTTSTSSAPAAGTPDPGSAQATALQMVTARGWGTDQYSCLVSLWNRESGWNVYAYNSSGAYGIPQALPGSKMASAGADWQTSAATQITWGLNYISGHYGTPCAAWAHSESTNWY